VAKTNRQFNLAKELHNLDLEPTVQRDLKRLLVA
jgi:hypothetical protein